MLPNDRPAAFERLEAIVQRDTRPPNETDDELFNQLKKFEDLNTEQMHSILASALTFYNRSIEKNMTAMAQERRRLQEQNRKMHQEMLYNMQIRVDLFNDREEMRDALMQFVLQRVKMDEASAELEQRSEGSGDGGLDNDGDATNGWI